MMKLKKTSCMLVRWPTSFRPFQDRLEQAEVGRSITA